MRVMVIVKATPQSEAGVLPTTEMLAAMGRFNQELVDAGIMKAAEGLHASAKGKRVRFQGKERVVLDGPFAETRELIAGFWIWKVGSMEEAVELVKRAPFGHDGEVEIRRVFESEDFGDIATPEMRERKRRQREALGEQV